MTDDENQIDFQELFEEFPELADPDAIYEKEVLAHFGLLFSKYANLEASLQMCFVFWNQRDLKRKGSIQTEDQWEASFDELEQKAFKATFGNLLRMVETISELDAEREQLTDLKEKRDYFAHHFFRQENENMHSNESIFFLLSKMQLLRWLVEATTRRVDKVYIDIMESLFPHKNVASETSELMASLKAGYLTTPRKGVGWD